MNQLVLTRKVERGWEYVSFDCDQDRMRVMEYQADQPKELYKEYLCFLCGYPESEWMRIADVQVSMGQYGRLRFTVKFANPGKMIEQWELSSSPDGPLVYTEPPAIDEEAWAITKLMLSRSASGEGSTAHQL